MSRSGPPAMRGPRQYRQIALAAVCALSISTATVHATGDGSQLVTHTKEHFKDEPIEDTNPCNNHPVIGQGTLTFSITEKATPGMFETSFEMTEHGQAHWVVDPAERYQYFSVFAQTSRSTTPNFHSTTEFRTHITRIGPHEQGRRSRDDSWFFWEKVTMSSTGANHEKSRYECQ
jgi:hypothetical protein